MTACGGAACLRFGASVICRTELHPIWAELGSAQIGPLFCAGSAVAPNSHRVIALRCRGTQTVARMEIFPLIRRKTAFAHSGR
ncbi:MAG: hypothetical protein HQL23_00650 [Candidatus Omnitrophica bacterium]|nr:hypothetical protein [Candidatus Omnitrophota bacterium]